MIALFSFNLQHDYSGVATGLKALALSVGRITKLFCISLALRIFVLKQFCQIYFFKIRVDFSFTSNFNFQIMRLVFFFVKTRQSLASRGQFFSIITS